MACGVKGSSASAGGAAGAANATVVAVAVSRRRMVRLMFIGGGSGRGAGRTAAPAKAGAAGGSGGQGRTVTLVGLETPVRKGNPGSSRTRTRKTSVRRWVSRYFTSNVPYRRRVVLTVVQYEPRLTCRSTAGRASAGAPATAPRNVTVWPRRRTRALVRSPIFAITWRPMSVVEAKVASSICVRYAKRIVRERTAVVV